MAAKRRLFESSEEISSGRLSVRSTDKYQHQRQREQEREKKVLVEQSTITISSDNDEIENAPRVVATILPRNSSRKEQEPPRSPIYHEDRISNVLENYSRKESSVFAASPLPKGGAKRAALY